MLLSKTYSFEAAHQLPDWPDVHGHSYEVEIWLEDTSGGDYVLPLSKIDAAVEPILKKIDHRMLNDIMEMPTMENIARWFWNELKDTLPLSRIDIIRPTLKFRCRYNGKD
jgi:6-pyruvoyltetrahydropterin/6-carboxytetrahydropterin synthase